MIGRIVLATCAFAPCFAIPAAALAQDVPGIEICTAEKTMERRTSCLQSNIDFLQRTITRLAADHQQKIDAANRQIEGLKATLAALQKIVDDLQGGQKKTAEEQNRKVQPPQPKEAPQAKDTPQAGEAPAAAKDAAK